jgi:hypothetical protein
VKRAVIRLPSEVVDRLDRLAEELRLLHPDESYSRASVARALISGGLRLAEGDQDRLLDVARRAARTASSRRGSPRGDPEVAGETPSDPEEIG